MTLNKYGAGNARGSKETLFLYFLFLSASIIFASCFETVSAIAYFFGSTAHQIIALVAPTDDITVIIIVCTIAGTVLSVISRNKGSCFFVKHDFYLLKGIFYLILVYITLKVNSGITAIVKYLRGVGYGYCRKNSCFT